MAAGVGSANEYNIKAALLFNLTKMVTWPEKRLTASEPDFQVCLFGDNPFDSRLNGFTRKTVSDHPVKIVTDVSLDELDQCHIVFISKEGIRHLANILYRINQKGILSVGDTAGFLEQGGMINFVKLNDRMNIEINQCIANKSGFEIDAKLLALASTIIRDC